MFECASESIRLTLFELQGKYISHVCWINSIKKGLFTGSLFSRDKCGSNAKVSNAQKNNNNVKKKKKGGFWHLFPTQRLYMATWRCTSWPCRQKSIGRMLSVVCRPSCKTKCLARGKSYICICMSMMPCSTRLTCRGRSQKLPTFHQAEKGHLWLVWEWGVYTGKHVCCLLRPHHVKWYFAFFFIYLSEQFLTESFGVWVNSVFVPSDSAVDSDPDNKPWKVSQKKERNKKS